MLLPILGISVFWFTVMFATAYLLFSHGKERINFNGKKLRYSVITVSFIISFTFILFFWIILGLVFLEVPAMMVLFGAISFFAGLSLTVYKIIFEPVNKGEKAKEIAAKNVSAGMNEYTGYRESGLMLVLWIVLGIFVLSLMFFLRRIMLVQMIILGLCLYGIYINIFSEKVKLGEERLVYRVNWFNTAEINLKDIVEIREERSFGRKKVELVCRLEEGNENSTSKIKIVEVKNIDSLISELKRRSAAGSSN